MRNRLTLMVASVVVVGCHAPAGLDRTAVSQRVEQRMGQSVAAAAPTAQPLIPPGLELGQPLSPDHAVLIALWNNAAFQEALVELQLTKADLIQANLLPNPEFLYYWPADNKPLKWLVDFPIESIWLRPIRLKVARAENARACDRLTQLALDLIRDTRVAFADVALAQDRVKVAQQSVELRSRVLALAEAREKAGDASPQEVSTARIDATLARQEAVRIGYDVTIAEERLKNFLGLGNCGFPVRVQNNWTDHRVELPVEELVAEAITARPDVTAAAAAVKGAEERLRFARIGWVRFLGIVDATSGRSTGHEASPALRMTVPLFNQNQGGIARAKAELEVLRRRQVTLTNQVILDVRTAHVRYLQARTELDYLKLKTRPEVELAIRRAGIAYKQGEAAYLIVLEATRQLLITYAQEATLASDLQRSIAELERAVGRRLTPHDPSVLPPSPPPSPDKQP